LITADRLELEFPSRGACRHLSGKGSASGRLTSRLFAGCGPMQGALFSPGQACTRHSPKITHALIVLLTPWFFSRSLNKYGAFWCASSIDVCHDHLT
jgi:hypothetical protein